MFKFACFMGAKFKIYPERELLVDFLTGDVDLEVLKELLMAEQRDEGFHWVKKVLSDIRNATPKVALEDIQDYLGILRKIPLDPEFRWAILTTTPYQTALSILISKDPFFLKFVGVFTSLNACTGFLNLTFKEIEFEDKDFNIT
jgi:hypothetical protein